MKTLKSYSLFLVLACLGVALGFLIGSLVDVLWLAFLLELAAGAGLGLFFMFVDERSWKP